MREVAIIGATLSGNKGAASMLQSVLDNLPPLLGEVRFNVLSVYPVEDRRLNDDRQVDIIPARPMALLAAVPLAALWAVFQRLRLPLGPLRSSPLLAALERSDLLIDVGGISFSDGRVIELGYNIACVLPALLMGKRIMKYSQAMGPFRTLLNRALAKAILPRLTLNVARGRRTLRHLQELGLKDVPLCADAAFSMQEKETEETRRALQALKRFGQRRIIGVSASVVLQSYCKRHNIDYPQALAGFADRAIEEGYGIWLIAHAVRKSRKGGRTNDVETCETVYELLEEKQHCQLITEDYSPATLRAIIGECDFFIASRLHAVVSSLTKGVPSLVTGWSHKYTEVLEMFDMEKWVIAHRQLSADGLWAHFQQLVENEASVREKISQHLPEIVASSRKNAVLAASLLED